MGSRTTQSVGLDLYETDDTSSQAGVIVLNAVEAQQHNFHDAGDTDWVKFFGLDGEIYTILVSEAAGQCDAVFEVYDSDGSRILAPVDDTGPGQNEIRAWTCAQDGIYFVKIRNYDPAVFGAETGYDLQVMTETAPFPGFIKGTVVDAGSASPIPDALLQTSGNLTALSLANTGGFVLVHPPGDFTLFAAAAGYEGYSTTVTVNEMATTNQTISMTPVPEVSGNLNGDLRTDLADAVIGLKILSGCGTDGSLRTDYAASGADVDTDGIVGLSEVIFILQRTAGLR